VSEQMPNGTSAQNRVFSAITQFLPSHTTGANIFKLWAWCNFVISLCSPAQRETSLQ